MTLARWFEDEVWYGRSPWALPLVPLSWLYQLAISARRQAYQSGLLPLVRLPVPVVIVGNLTVGGTGKTPVVAWLVSRLQAAGLAPGIVSRGYGGGSPTRPLRITAATPVEEAGDEPLLLARRTGVPVAVCRDRLAAATALAADGVDVIVADDGLQHHALARDLEIVVIDGERGFGNGWLLPAGPLREPAARAGEAGLVLVNGGTPPLGARVFRLQPGAAVRLCDGARADLAAFAGRRVWAVAGIGNPPRFHAGLRERGIVVDAVEVADHGRVDLASLRRRAAQPVLMTEKDAVKYPGCSDPDVWYIPVDLEMAPDDEQAVMKRVLAVAGDGP